MAIETQLLNSNFDTMKRLFFLLAAIVVMATAEAQLVTLTSPGVMTNGATLYVGPKQVNLYHDMISAFLIVTKGTGTVAGNANLEISHDGTNYATAPNATQVTLADAATQSFAWSVYPSSGVYYRIRVTTTGTQTSTPTGTLLIRDKKGP